MNPTPLGSSHRPRWLPVAVALSFCAMASGCTDDSSSSPSPDPVRGLSAELVVGGGADPDAEDPRRVRLAMNVTDNERPVTVADDGAVWSVRRGVVGDCPARPKSAQNDRLLRVSVDGVATSVDFSFIDTTHLEGAESTDCPTIVAGPVAAADGSVIVTVSSHVEHPQDRRWWRAYVVAADGSVELWEPALPPEYRVVGLGSSAASEALVIGGYRADWDAPWDSPNLPVDGYRLFAVDPVTLQARAIGQETGATTPVEDPGWIGSGGDYPPATYSLALLSDGRLAYWSDSEQASGLWVQGADGLMQQIIDANETATPSGSISAAPPGEPVGTLGTFAGAPGANLEPGPDGQVLVKLWHRGFAGLDAAAYRVNLGDLPSGSDAQRIVDASFATDGSTVGLQDGRAPAATVVLSAQALAGDPEAPVTVVNVGSRNVCVWASSTDAVCGGQRDAQTEAGYWKDWAYYRLPVTTS